MNRILQKISKGMKNNSGFTLIELLTSLSIFAFFSIALLQYMKTASSIQSQVGANVNLETTSQVAMSLVEEFLIDASASVMFDDATHSLYIINNSAYGESTTTGTVTTPIAHVFQWVPTMEDWRNNGTDYNKGDVNYFSIKGGLTKTTETTTTTEVIRQSLSEADSKLRFTKTEVVQVVNGQPPTTISTTVVQETLKNDIVMDTDGTLLDIPLLTSAWSEERTVSSEVTSDITGLSNTGNYTSPEKLCENVTAFSVALDPTDKSDGGSILSCTLTFEMENYRFDRYAKDLFIVLRNKPSVADGDY